MDRSRVVLLATLLAAGVYASGGVFGWSQTRAGFWAGTILMVAGPVVGGLLAITRAFRLRGRARASWLLLGAGACAWAAGQASYSFYELALKSSPPFPGPPDVGFLSASVLLAAGAFCYPSVHGRGWSFARSGLDAGLIMVSMLLISWSVVIGGIYAAGGQEWTERAVAVAYPCGDVLVLSMLLLAVRRTAVGGREPLSVLLVGMVLLVVGDTGYLLLTAQDAYYTGNPIDIGWWAGLLLVGVAATTYKDRGAPHGAPSLRPWAIFVPYGVTVIALTVATWHAIAAGALEVSQFQVWLAGAVVLLLLARQSVVALDSVSLTGQLRRREDELRHHAYHDPLTQLPNRRSLRDHLDAEMMGGRRGEAVCFIDLDGFKEVNDTLGHQGGDVLLQEVADRMRQAVRGDDVVARLGGDEFAVVLATGSDPHQAADRLLARLREPFHIGGATVSVSGSIGIAPWSSAESGEELLRNADLAMYRAKNGGRDQASSYEPALHEQALDRLSLQVALREALDHHEFSLHYQPLVDVTTGTVIGVEALVRWERDGTLLPPAEFLYVAEDTGLIVPLGDWILDTACADLATWHATGHPDLALAVNIAAGQLNTSDLAARVAATLGRRGISPDRLTFEITDSVLLGSQPRTHTALEELAGLGIGLALDDFGTGHASLPTLRALPFTTIKIDGSITAELEHGPSALVNGITALAGHLGLKVVAEGVETPYQHAMLRTAGIGQAQGFHYARPVPTKDVQHLLLQATPALTSP
ncbi:MAG: putative bifunctional diguanylate cyclase/phosphodiesterase [Actinomycetes bacterium]